MEASGLSLRALGWSAAWEEVFAAYRRDGVVEGRVAVEARGGYIVFGEGTTWEARVAGRFMGRAAGAAEFPKVGDWVVLAPVDGGEKAVIQAVLPRRTRLARKVAGRPTEEQVLVANVDRAFIVQALDAGYNARLLERYLAMVREAGVEPVILLNKVDLDDHVPERHAEAGRLAGEARVLDVSARTGTGLAGLRGLIGVGTTAVFVGKSGVGKSSLINRLYGEEVQATAEVREHDAKGRHTTSWRELIVLPEGGVVIDTPGMREFHLWMAGADLDEAFPDIVELAAGCRFRDCGHGSEKGCAVWAAVWAGTLGRDRLEAFRKLQAELIYLEEARREAPRSAGRGRRRGDEGGARSGRSGWAGWAEAEED